MMAYTAYAFEDNSIMDALKFSFNQLTWKRILKFIGVGLAFSFGLGMVSMLSGQISLAISNIPVLGFVIGSILQFIAGVISTVVLTSAFTALYYRFADNIDGDEDFAVMDHLVEM